MSIGFSGMTIWSSSPSWMPCNNAVASTRSSRVSGNRMPLGMPYTECPLLPTRCRNTAMLFGEENCTTKSTDPTSIPSSIDAVATSTFSSPFLKRCSALWRWSLLMLPWWEQTLASPSRSLSARASLSDSLLVLTKISVVSWVLIRVIRRS